MYLKPKYFANLNRNHRHAKDLVFCSLMNENTGLQTWDFTGRNSYEFDGTYTPSWGVGGVEFNANREHINGIPLNSITTGDCTIMFSYKTTNDPASYFYWFAVGDTYSTLSLLEEDNGYNSQMYIGGTSFSFGNLSMHDYNVIAVTVQINGGDITASLYLDGLLIASITETETFPNSSDLINIGGRTDSDGRYAGGIIEYFYIWDKVLSDTEVFQVSNNPFAMFETMMVPFMDIIIPIQHYARTIYLTGDIA